MGKQTEALTAVIDGKQAEIMQLQLKCSALTDRVEAIEKERESVEMAFSQLEAEVKQRLREDESKLKGRRRI